jgi:hypothetical protein
VYFDDTDGKQMMYRRRANTALATSGISTISIIQVRNCEKVKEAGVDFDKLPRLSSVVPTALNSSRGALGAGIDLKKRAKHTRKVFKLVPDYLQHSNYSASDHWEVAEIDDDTKGLFIPIDRFNPESKFIQHTSLCAQFGKMLSNLKKAGVNVPDIYGVKKSSKNTFDKWFEDTVNALSADDCALKDEYDKTNGYPHYFRPLNFSVKNLPESHPVRAYHDIRQQATKLDTNIISAKKWLFAKVAKKYDASTVITAAHETMMETYPILKYVKDETGKTRAQVLLDYISDVDILNTKYITKAA